MLPRIMATAFDIFLGKSAPGAWSASMDAALAHVRETASRLALAARADDVPAMRAAVSEILLFILAACRLQGFDIDALSSGMAEKIRRRMQPREGDGRHGSWKAGKAREKALPPSPAEISPELPPLMRIPKILRGVSHPNPSLDGFCAHVEAGELGSAIFSLGAFAFAGKLDAEHALRTACNKFITRLSYAEGVLAGKGLRLLEVPLDDMMALWHEAKRIPKPKAPLEPATLAPFRSGMAGADDLLALAESLADPAAGDSWTLSQSPFSIALHAVEEAYEVADAWRKQDMPLFAEELGDMMMQVVFIAENCRRAGYFGFADILRNAPGIPPRTGIFAGMPEGFSATAAALWLQKMAVQNGFEWRDEDAAIAKVHEEVAELAAEIEKGDTLKAEDELGDLLFATVKLARWRGIAVDDAIVAGIREHFA